MSYRCPQGHTSEADDFCDTCGAKIDPASALVPEPDPAPSGEGTLDPSVGSVPPAPAGQTCPNCQTPSAPDSLFCEACGYDFTTGAMPRGADGGAAEPSGAESPETDPPGGQPAAGDPAGPASAPGTDPGPSGIPPATPMEWVAEVWIDPEWYAAQEADEPMPSPGLPVVVPLAKRSALIGRVSASRNIHPDIDATADSGVSRRQAQLSTDGTRWFVEDLDSSNGTYVGSMLQPLPEDPIPVGPKRELEEGDRVYVGAWTRIVVRRATDEEKAAAAAS